MAGVRHLALGLLAGQRAALFAACRDRDAANCGCQRRLTCASCRRRCSLLGHECHHMVMDQSCDQRLCLHGVQFGRYAHLVAGAHRLWIADSVRPSAGWLVHHGRCDLRRESLHNGSSRLGDWGYRLAAILPVVVPVPQWSGCAPPSAVDPWAVALVIYGSVFAGHLECLFDRDFGARSDCGYGRTYWPIVDTDLVFLDGWCAGLSLCQSFGSGREGADQMVSPGPGACFCPVAAAISRGGYCLHVGYDRLHGAANWYRHFYPALSALGCRRHHPQDAGLLR